MKVLFCVGKAYVPIREMFVKRIEALGAEVTCLTYLDTKKTIIENIKDVTVYITAVSPADRDIIDAAPHLKYIIKTGTGVDNIDVDYATEKGIAVTNAPGGNATAVAELAIGLMISLSRRIPELDRQTKSGAWLTSTGFECTGKALGLIGFGTIGQLVAQFTEGFKMKKLAFGSYKDHRKAEELGVTFVELDELLAESDYLVISTSLKKSTYHLIDAEALQKMKRSAFLINISRGAIIDQPALFDALRKNTIRGAALDVLEAEPPEEPLPDLDHLIVTPHTGGTTLESVYRITDITIENIRRFISHEPVKYQLN